jgi:Predicted phosphohydrolases
MPTTPPPQQPCNASPEDRNERRRLKRRTFLRACGVGLGGAVALPVQARYVEPNLIDVTHHEVFLPELPPEAEGLRVVQLTDLHRGPTTPLETIRQAVDAAVAEKPDAFVLTGDLVHNRVTYAEPLAEMLQPLRRAGARFGVFACLGNHDYPESADVVASVLEARAGVRFLRNANAELAPGLHVAGVEDHLWGRPDAHAARAGVAESSALIVLAHNPRAVFDWDQRSCVVLAGHTHGGQVLLPGVTPRVPPDVKGFPLVAGWGQFDQAHLYVNRGVGMSGLPLRFRCRPEVAVFTLRRGDSLPRTRPGLGDRAVRKAGRLARAAWHRFT